MKPSGGIPNHQNWPPIQKRHRYLNLRLKPKRGGCHTTCSNRSGPSPSATAALSAQREVCVHLSRGSILPTAHLRPLHFCSRDPAVRSCLPPPAENSSLLLIFSLFFLLVVESSCWWSSSSPSSSFDMIISKDLLVLGQQYLNLGKQDKSQMQ